MSIGKTILLVCRRLSEIHLLQQFRPQPDCRYVVGSDDLRVHLEIEKFPWVAEVCFLEQMESYYVVAGDVLKYLEVINQWLKSLGNDPQGIPQELLFWIRLCEGGMTTQRIQDLLLLIRSYHYLLDTYNVSLVIVLRHPQGKWEDDVLVKVAQSKGIDWRIMGHFRRIILKAWLLSLIKLIGREPYYILYILRTKLRGHFRSRRSRNPEKEIIVQMCSSEEKFVEDVVPLMKALKARGYELVALLWRASEAAVKFQQEGLGAEDLEKFVPLSAVWEAPYRVWLTWRQARRRRKEFWFHTGLQYNNVALGPLLWPSVRAFFWEELSQRFRLRQAAEKYFANHFPQAIRLWGAGILSEGAMVAMSFKNKQRPVTFFWGWAFYENPYCPSHSFNDLFLAAGDTQKEYFEKLGVPSHHIAKVGLSRYAHLHDFWKEYSSVQSRTYLKIPQDFKNYILYDSNSDLRGYTTIREQSLVTKSLLHFARGNPLVALLIKPHPTHRPGWLEALIDFFALPNVFLIDKNMLPYHALNAADMLITKFSNIALEAMLFKKPVVSILLDKEERFRIYGDAVERVNNLKALEEMLTMVAGDASWRADWERNQISHQASFLREYFGDSFSKSAQRGAEAIDKHLQAKLSVEDHYCP